MYQAKKKNYPIPDINLANSVVSSNTYTGLVPSMPGTEEEAEAYESLYNSQTNRI
ncbi:MAG: hypothetical protein FWF50_06960 [Defluviitaleaceae bacterium]|nr:hypothetical protein [Defluviitaleaceae bacterium]